MENKFTKPLQPGQLIARGVARYLRSLGYVSLKEFVPTRGLRVDIMALGPKVSFGSSNASHRALILIQISNGKNIWNGQIDFSGQLTKIFLPKSCLGRMA